MKTTQLIKLLLTGAAILGLQFGLTAGVEKGTWELAMSGSYSNLDAGGSDIDMIQANLKAGYFTTSAFELSGMLTYLDADLDDLDLKATMLGAGADYHFGSGDILPYVGAAIYWVDVELEDLSDDDFAWDIHAGLKQFVAENVAIDYRVTYVSFDDLDLDGFSVGFGFSFFF